MAANAPAGWQVGRDVSRRGAGGSGSGSGGGGCSSVVFDSLGAGRGAGAAAVAAASVVYLVASLAELAEQRRGENKSVRATHDALTTQISSNGRDESGGGSSSGGSGDGSSHGSGGGSAAANACGSRADEWPLPSVSWLSSALTVLGPRLHLLDDVPVRAEPLLQLLLAMRRRSCDGAHAANPAADGGDGGGGSSMGSGGAAAEAAADAMQAAWACVDVPECVTQFLAFLYHAVDGWMDAQPATGVPRSPGVRATEGSAGDAARRLHLLVRFGEVLPALRVWMPLPDTSRPGDALCDRWLWASVRQLRAVAEADGQLLQVPPAPRPPHPPPPHRPGGGGGSGCVGVEVGSTARSASRLASPHKNSGVDEHDSAGGGGGGHGGDKSTRSVRRRTTARNACALLFAAAAARLAPSRKWVQVYARAAAPLLREAAHGAGDLAALAATWTALGRAPGGEYAAAFSDAVRAAAAGASTAAGCKHRCAVGEPSAPLLDSSRTAAQLNDAAAAVLVGFVDCLEGLPAGERADARAAAARLGTQLAAYGSGHREAVALPVLPRLAAASAAAAAVPGECTEAAPPHAASAGASVAAVHVPSGHPSPDARPLADVPPPPQQRQLLQQQQQQQQLLQQPEQPQQQCVLASQQRFPPQPPQQPQQLQIQPLAGLAGSAGSARRGRSARKILDTLGCMRADAAAAAGSDAPRRRGPSFRGKLSFLFEADDEDECSGGGGGIGAAARRTRARATQLLLDFDALAESVPPAGLVAALQAAAALVPGNDARVVPQPPPGRAQALEREGRCEEVAQKGHSLEGQSMKGQGFEAHGSEGQSRGGGSVISAADA
eukprot:90796-Chlamydomonas_euryale.AAC.1